MQSRQVVSHMRFEIDATSSRRVRKRNRQSDKRREGHYCHPRNEPEKAGMRSCAQEETFAYLTPQST